jgi:glycosyltransferase involved in cell wall biosynthesis
MREGVLMKSNNILLIVPFTSLKNEVYFNRFRYLALQLTLLDYDVTILTSNFEHFTKTFRKESSYYEEGYKIVFLKEKGYKQNIGPGRLISHHYFCKELEIYLNNLQKRPDLIYSAFPLICSNLVAGKYIKEHNIPFVIDIQDTWPESISSFFGKYTKYINPLIQLFARRANNAYRYADGLVAVSKTYLDRGTSVANPDEYDVAFIGADIEQIKAISAVEKKSNEFWVSYIGTLSYSYDMETIIYAANILKEHKNIKFLIIGQGKEKEKLQTLNETLDTQVNFLGIMPYEEMISYLKQSDIGLNAIKGHAIQSITNKLSDYICTNTPILNCAENKEVQDLIEDNEIGFNYTSENPKELAEKILMLYNNRNKLTNFKENIQIIQSRFDRGIEYKKIYKMIRSLLKKNNV